MKRKDIPTLSVIQAVQTYKLAGFWCPAALLMHRHNAPEKLVYSAMSRDEKKGYLEYGVSLRFPWVTDLGYKFMAEQVNKHMNYTSK